MAGAERRLQGEFPEPPCSGRSPEATGGGLARGWQASLGSGPLSFMIGHCRRWRGALEARRSCACWAVAQGMDHAADRPGLTPPNGRTARSWFGCSAWLGMAPIASPAGPLRGRRPGHCIASTANWPAPQDASGATSKWARPRLDVGAPATKREAGITRTSARQPHRVRNARQAHRGYPRGSHTALRRQRRAAVGPLRGRPLL